MAQLGVKSYRFSISWCRLLPEGVGPVNQSGVDFYNQLIDELLAHGITPMITLFHWDYPQALWDRGGLLVRDSAEWFGEYAALCFKSYGDRVKLWLTLNELAVFTDCGLRKGVHAPGLTDWDAMLLGGHNLMRGHGRAVQALRAASSDGKIGVAFALGPNLPETDTPQDKHAARLNGAYSRRFVDPIMLGEYPPRFEKMFAGHMPEGFEKDLPLISQKLDHIGVNYYSKWHVTWDESVPFLKSRGVPAYQVGEDVKVAQASFYRGTKPPVSRRGHRLSPTGWEIRPEGLYETLLWARQRYGDYEFYITENGAAADATHVDRETELADQYRIDYMREHLHWAHRAMQEGIKVRGYMAWTLMDNLEWAAGYRVRCGLVHCDFATLERTWKHSARWYQQVVAANAVS